MCIWPCRMLATLSFLLSDKQLLLFCSLLSKFTAWRFTCTSIFVTYGILCTYGMELKQTCIRFILLLKHIMEKQWNYAVVRSHQCFEPVSAYICLLLNPDQYLEKSPGWIGFPFFRTWAPWNMLTWWSFLSKIPRALFTIGEPNSPAVITHWVMDAFWTKTKRRNFVNKE
jgi:hypothetical protein